jgi:acetoin utilization deacetylase AcuC-like enzyme
MTSKRSRTSVAVFSPPSSCDALGHNTKFPDGTTHQENHERATHVLRALKTSKFSCELVRATAAMVSETHACMALVHDAKYLHLLRHLCSTIGDFATGALTPRLLASTTRKQEGDTRFCANSLETAIDAAVTVVCAVDWALAMNGRAFCVVRPPGHHAGPSGPSEDADGCGFCLLNNVAIGVQHYLRKHPQGKALILDLDVHHGNGTEACVRRIEGKVMYASLHLLELFEDSDLDFFPGTGKEEVSTDAYPWIVNCPLRPMWPLVVAGERPKPPIPTYSGRQGWRDLFTQTIMTNITKFQPDIIFISAGFDACKGDEGNISADGAHEGIDLLAEDYAWATKQLPKVVPIVSVLEGGYGTFAEHKYEYTYLVECVHAHVEALLG